MDSGYTSCEVTPVIAIGDRLPGAVLFESTAFGEACPLEPERVKLDDELRNKRIVIFALPGAFTSTCSEKHVPGYLEHYDDFRSLGVDAVWCVSVNDGYVMTAWGRELGALGKLRMLGDGNAEFTRSIGLDQDRSSSGLGTRSRRYSMLVDNGIVQKLNIETPGKFEVSDAATLLGQLR